MAYFTANDIESLNKLHNNKLSIEFGRKHSSYIEDEMNHIIDKMQTEKNQIMDRLNDMSFLKTTEAVISEVVSFNFSKVGGINTRIKIPGYDESYRLSTYGQEAPLRSPSSYRNNVNIFSIWKSNGFLKKLGEKLQLPPNIYFVINSTEIKNTKYFSNPDVVVYRNALTLVVRFSK